VLGPVMVVVYGENGLNIHEFKWKKCEINGCWPNALFLQLLSFRILLGCNVMLDLNLYA
jgi:hypothetical protein